MLQFRNTAVYQKSLELMKEIAQLLKEKSNPLIQAEAHQKIFQLLEKIAEGVAEEQAETMQKTLLKARENLHALISLLDFHKTLENIQDPTAVEKIINKIQELSCELHHFAQKRKRILILTSTFGHGHLSAAKGVKQGLEEKYGQDYAIEIVDLGALINTLMNKTSMKIYEGSSKFTPKIYKFFFDLTDNDKMWQIKLLNLINYPFYVNRLTKFFQDKNPDLIISTFVFWDYIAMEIWKKYKPQTKFMSIITDSISIHRAWITSGTNYHIVPNHDTAEILQKMKVPENKIKVLGFPVQLSFIEPTNREEFFKKIELTPKNFTVLFLPTAQQQSKNRRIMDELLKGETSKQKSSKKKRTDYNIIVITGRDEKAKKSFEKYEDLKNVKIIGWTDQMPDFIKSADLVITKAGGATIMECIAAKKPVVITSVIEGQESGNAELIERHQLGIIASQKNSDIARAVKKIHDNYDLYQKNMSKLSNPDASLKIARFIHEVMSEK